jgi:hypothetical protein
LTWNLETDEVVAGQWITGHVFTRRCDLSPNGRLLVGAFSNYSVTKNAQAQKEFGVRPFEASFWTAVSRPPFFSALALWFMSGAYNGGGMWLDDQQLGLNNQPYTYKTAKPMLEPYSAVELSLGAGEDLPLWPKLLKSRGWQGLNTFVVRKGRWMERARRKPFANGEIRYSESHSFARFIWASGETWDLHDEKGKIVREWGKQQEGLTWIDVDHRGRLLIADRGLLQVWEGFPEGEPRHVSDLTDNKFEPVAPPDWAQQW